MLRGLGAQFCRTTVGNRPLRDSRIPDSTLTSPNAREYQLWPLGPRRLGADLRLGPRFEQQRHGMALDTAHGENSPYGFDTDPLQFGAGSLTQWTSGVVFVCLLIVLRLCVDPESVRDGRETSVPAPGDRFRARGGGLGGAPKPYNVFCYSHPDVRHAEFLVVFMFVFLVLLALWL